MLQKQMEDGGSPVGVKFYLGIICSIGLEIGVGAKCWR